ncbi:hypothetical protein EPUS_03002 [Endocarpon pusillum Z07020]|uniref:Uncharacterized protein n=1 Tax=Endocarpon pusillum (strain Z07020 / HMAS-L-300199) TaxID=1263415 RepID=U1GMP9_ENDPU|nr:uncharacterized protein EPUS_03002 [Endocarpon pusillum Z07020]ERF73161.1 hypothetical protein EPUS_03002 [Endocarpon pusillum Z07020]
MIEWVYVIDLDQEIIHIQSRSAKKGFRLQSIPRQLQWAEGLEEGEEEEEEADEDVDVDDEAEERRGKEEGEGDREEEDDKEEEEMPTMTTTGQAIASLPEPFAPSRASLDRYDLLKVRKVKPRGLSDLSGERAYTHALREWLFKQFIGNWDAWLARRLLDCRPHEFIYREVVFAIISLASGDFKFLANQSPPSKGDEVLEVRLGSPNGPSILPDFGSGMHALNTLPGSAPASTTYWFKGVLVVLVDASVAEDGIKAAIAAATDLGQKSGHKLFDALIIHLLTFTLLLTSLPGPATNLDSGHVRGNRDAFSVLMEIFNVAAAYTLKPFKPVGHIRLSQQPSLTPIPDEETRFIHHTVKGISSTTSDWIIYDAIEGRDVESHVHAASGPGQWAPVIGHGDRQSMMVDCAIHILALASHPFPTAEDHQIELHDAEFYSLRAREKSLGHELEVFGLRHFGFEHFCIPKFASVRDVSSAWKGYLDYKLMKSWPTDENLMWEYSPLEHRYLLPCNTASCPIEIYGRHVTNARGMKCTEMGGMIWLRKAVDLELESVRQRTLTEAQEFLSSKVWQEAERTQPMRKGLLVVAFGTKAQCFDWSFTDNPTDVQPVLTPVVEEAAVLDVAIKDQRDRFEQIFGRWCDEVQAASVAKHSTVAVKECEHADTDSLD